VTNLIIFDSDGVLVDSERIALTVLAQAPCEEGVGNFGGKGGPNAGPGFYRRRSGH
jgi:hypothetical protein